ncbi:unnamed protein product [Meganyctiphanes norvegica]|uniref:Major facilitator superfamily (MFS) profile domain-containing protein n=1 Tax=Meganyctiphanes norvegica TaxID=48144 RepID=A0AAV2SL43_MEGNR
MSLLRYLDESPRWLLVRGHTDRAKKVLQKAAHYNGVSFSSDQHLDCMLADIQNETINEKKAPVGSNENISYTKRFQRCISGILVLFRTPRLRQIVLLIYIDFFVVSMVYYGISLNGVNYGVNPFLYMVISGVSEIPAYTLSAPLIAKFGRRLPITWCFLICGGAIVSLAFVPNNDSTWGLTIFLVTVGKMFISVVYQVLYLYTMELLPTEVRLTGLGTTGCVSRIGSIFCPYVTELLGVSYPWLPSLLFGGFSIVAGLTNLGLHDTLGAPMPDTVEDVENYRKTRTPNEDDKTSELQKIKI